MGGNIKSGVALSTETLSCLDELAIHIRHRPRSFLLKHDQKYVRISTVLFPLPFFMFTTHPTATDAETQVIVDGSMLGLVAGSLKCISLHERRTTNDQQLLVAIFYLQL